MIKLEIGEKLTFLVVGGLCFVGYILLARELYAYGLSLTLASAAAYLLFIPIGYCGQRWCTFSSSRPHIVASMRYIALQLLAVLLTSLVSFVFSQVLGWPATFVLFVAATVAASTSYLVQKVWVF